VGRAGFVARLRATFPPVSTPTSGRSAALIFIFVTILVDVLAFGLIIPVLPHLVEDLVGGDVVDAAYWVGVFSTTFAVIQPRG